jgi:outer membrane immunogenic protein
LSEPFFIDREQELELKQVGLTIALFAALTTTAVAADFPVKAPIAAPIPSWTGFYVGASLGGRWADTTGDEISVFVNGVQMPCPPGVPCVMSDTYRGSALRVGGHAGYNWQVSPAWVIGVEGDAGWADQRTTHLGGGLPGAINGFLIALPGNPPNGAADSFSVRTKWDASARVRLGFLVTPSTLLYLTGGAAWLNFDSTSSCALAPAGSCAPTVSPLSITNDTTRLGWTLGGGGEFRLTSNWFLRGEYRFADFGTSTYVNMPVNNPFGFPFVYRDTYSLHVRTHTGLVGISYKFN